MREPIDLLTPGRDLWGMVRREPIVLAYDNPWRRFAVVCMVALLSIVAIRWGFGGDRWLLGQLALGVLAAAALLTSVRFVRGERRIGALLAEVTTQHVAVGSEVDRIVIPWSAVDTDVDVVPIDSRFMAIPVMKGALDQLIYQSVEATATWDRRPYSCFIVEVRHNAAASWVEIHSRPNEFFVSLLNFVYPMIAVLRQERGTGSTESKEGPTLDRIEPD